MKILITLLGMLLIFYTLYNAIKGSIYIHGKIYDRREEPLGFYVSLMILLLFGIMLIYFGLK